MGRVFSIKGKMRSPSFDGTRVCAKLAHLVETGKMRKEGGWAKKPIKIVVSEENPSSKFQGFCTPRVRVKQRDVPQRCNGTELVRKLGLVFGVIFLRVRSLCLTCYLGMIF